MASDYEAIKQNNLTRYGTDVTEVVRLLSEDTYADRTHFIFELLQNAEDALKRRGDEWNGPCAVSFELSRDRLRVSHYGAPFDEKDVIGICGIARSTKATDLTKIGRFGIGFKSVYVFTDSPEVHSGDEDFAIESYVWPKAIPSTHPLDPDETVFILPFKDASAYPAINAGLKTLDAATLLFLSQIEEIKWRNADGESGRIIRATEPLDDGVRKIIVSAQTGPDTPSRREWMVFSRPVASKAISPAMTVDIAFQLNSESGEIEPATNAKLYTYFPTELETHVGFLMNGPYRTTLNRENVPPHDAWNRGLVSQTADLLVQSLKWLRDNDRLSVNALLCLPLEQWRFSDNLLAPLFEMNKSVLFSEPLLPKLGGGYISGDLALMARTAELREVFSPPQINVRPRPPADGWLVDEIRGSAILRSFCTTHLGVPEVRSEGIVRGLREPFLEAQDDEWIVRLYRFLYSRNTLIDIARLRPIVRLEGGKHVVPKINGEVQAYLPTDYDTGFPTVARSVYNAPLSPSVLRSLGLAHPDPVDGIIAYTLPKYQQPHIDVTDEEYSSDIQQIFNAHQGATHSQGGRLIDELKKARFIRSMDAKDRDDLQWDAPRLIYAHDGNMGKLFSGVKDIRLTDNSLEPAITSNIHALMEICGASDGLRTIEFDNELRFNIAQLREMRNNGDYTWHRGFSIDDKRILGLRPLLATLPKLELAARIDKAKLLWRELSRLNNFDFLGSYQWFYRRERSSTFDAQFVETLNTALWIPDAGGNLKRPLEVDFDSLGWPPNDLLQSKILFKPSLNKEMAMKAGVDESQLVMLDLIRDAGITDPSMLQNLLPMPKRTVPSPTSAPSTSQNGQTQTGPTRRDGRQNQPTPITATFAESLAAAMTDTPSRPRTNTVSLPPGGPKTGESARADVDATIRDGGSGAYEPRIATEWQPSEAASELAQKFRVMVRGDYGSRCQVCSRSFTLSNGEFQGFVVHVVPPSEDSRANNFGDLLGLCGWHYALICYGQWTLLDNDRNPLNDDPARLRRFVEEAIQDIDDGNSYVPIPIRFHNVYDDWNAQPQTIDAEIRYSIPHWTYLKELLKA